MNAQIKAATYTVCRIITNWCGHHGADTATKVQVQIMVRVPKETQENHDYLVLEEDFVIRVVVRFLFYINLFMYFCFLLDFW